MDEADIDICRVCRCEAGEQELFYPCICTGSIKYIHQDCLQQWMRYVSALFFLEGIPEKLTCPFAIVSVA